MSGVLGSLPASASLAASEIAPHRLEKRPPHLQDHPDYNVIADFSTHAAAMHTTPVPFKSLKAKRGEGSACAFRLGLAAL